MKFTADTLKRLASLNLPTEAFQGVLEIIAEMQAADEVRLTNQRNRKRKSRDGHGTVTGQERDGHTKERSPTPPKEKTTPSEVLSRTSSGAASAASAPVYSDSKHELWGEGVAILTQLGVADRSARSNIGRWLRDAKEDAQAVLGAIQRARDNRVIDPIPWITRTISSKGPLNAPENNRSLVAVSRRAANDAARAAGLVDEQGEPVLRVVSQG